MSTRTDERAPSVWATMREAVRGSHQDYTEVPVGRAVILPAIPMVLEMLMESVFASPTCSSSAGSVKRALCLAVYRT